MKRFNQNHVLTIILACLSIAAAFGLRHWLHPDLRLQSARLHQAPYPHLGFYMITPEENRPIYFSMLKGQWTLVYFSYGSCGDPCSRDLQQIGRMMQYFDSTEEKYRPQVIVISLDNRHDNAASMREYAKHFHIRMHGFTAHDDELERLSKLFAIKTDGRHDSRIFIVDPEVNYLGEFYAPYDENILVSDMQQLMRRFHLQ